MTRKALLLRLVSAAIKPSDSQATRQSGGILPANHVSRRVPRLPCGRSAKPFHISPAVGTLDLIRANKLGNAI